MMDWSLGRLGRWGRLVWRSMAIVAAGVRHRGSSVRRNSSPFAGRSSCSVAKFGEAAEVHVAGDGRNDRWEACGELLLGADGV